MASNFIQDGEILSLTAPYDVSSGDGFLVGSIFAVAKTMALSSASVEGATEGVWELAKATGTAWSVGDRIFWDDSAKKCTKTASGNTLIGVCTKDAASGDATGYVNLEPNYATNAETAQAANVAALTENGGAIGGSNDGDLPSLTATAATLTGSLTGTTDGALADVAAIALSTSNTYSDAAVNTAVNTAITATNLQLKEIQTVLNAVIADNVAQIAALRELAAKLNAEIAALKTATLQASS
jgi:predicted RecA/RadA family phage recombinase